MESIWMGIAPSATSTRVLAMAGPHDTILKARLSRSPAHPRAMATLLEAIALWQGRSIRAALCADAQPGGSDSSLFRETFTDVGGPLYTLDWIPAPERGRRARRRDISGMGEFADLRQLLIDEVARRRMVGGVARESTQRSLRLRHDVDGHGADDIRQRRQPDAGERDRRKAPSGRRVGRCDVSDRRMRTWWVLHAVS